MNYRIVLKSGETVKVDDYDDFVTRRPHFWWVLKSLGNGAVLATSELYTTFRKAFRTADALAKALDIEVEVAK